MTIGPEPMTRMRWRSARRGMNQVIDDVVARVPGGPPRRAAKLGVRADEDGNVHGASERWIHSNLSGCADSTQDGLRQCAHAHPFTAADVVGLSRCSLRQQREV